MRQLCDPVAPAAPAAPLPGLVARWRLVRRLLAAADVPVVLVVAPAGYGKTTTLIEWLEHEEREPVWITLSAADDDPVRLMSTIAHALAATGPVERDVLDALASERPPFVLVLDDAHRVTAAETLAALTSIADHLPRGSQLVLASRAEPALPIGRMRARRQIVELRAQDLAMTRQEAGALMTVSGLALRPDDVAMLVTHTEGWPAGLYLAALALLDQPKPDRALEQFVGEDRIICDYIRDELLSQLPRQRRLFLMRTSILETLSGPLCDAVLERSASASVLRDLARSNVLLVPLDRVDERYRYHTLFAEMLHSELRRIEPEYEAELHRRACAWHADRGDTERALHHAIAAGDVRRAGELVWSIAPHYIFQGRDATIRRWLERFTDEQVNAHPLLALTAATSELVGGRGAWVEHWASTAARGSAGNEPYVTILRAALGRQGIACIGEDAARAYGVQADDSPWRAVCCLLMGVAAHLTGDRAGAEQRLQEGARRGAVTAPAIRALCLAQLALLAFENGDLEQAAGLAGHARRQADHAGLLGQATSALVLAVSALACARLGRVTDARHDISEAMRLLVRLDDFAAWYEVETRITLARAALRLGDVVSARTLLAEASREVWGADAVVLRAWIDDGWAQVERFLTTSVVATTSLTTAELRLLGLLPTHMSFRELASGLHVSVHTVKTQAQAIYRKLEVCSRSEAVLHAREVGLLDA